MKVNGKHHRTIWLDGQDVAIIDQRALPFSFEIEIIKTAEQMVTAISQMHVRGAPLIGVAGAFGVYLAAREVSNLSQLTALCEKLIAARPTAVNLGWAVDKQLALVSDTMSWDEFVEELKENAQKLADEDVEICRSIGKHGLELIKEVAQKKKGEPINIKNHCNAGWLATIDYGTATSAIYLAHEKGIPVHVWVSETRPRLQGSKLTAFELLEEGIPHTVVVDNACGHLMQHKMVDMILVGTDRTTRTGDVCNKVGTYLKALAAKDNNVPFYVACPSPSIDWALTDGVRDIPIENRSSSEVLTVTGDITARIAPESSPAINYSFDVTPRELVTGIITERGIASANETSLLGLFPEKS